MVLYENIFTGRNEACTPQKHALPGIWSILVSNALERKIRLNVFLQGEDVYDFVQTELKNKTIIDNKCWW